MALSTLEEMLNAKLYTWHEGREGYFDGYMDHWERKEGYEEDISLREALNISLCNPFNFPIGRWGPIIGKSDVLKRVEAELKAELQKLKAGK